MIIIGLKEVDLYRHSIHTEATVPSFDGDHVHFILLFADWRHSTAAVGFIKIIKANVFVRLCHYRHHFPICV